MRLVEFALVRPSGYNLAPRVEALSPFKRLILSALTLTLAASAKCQTSVGIQPNGTYADGGIDKISVADLSVQVDIPLFSHQSRGANNGTDVHLRYQGGGDWAITGGTVRGGNISVFAGPTNDCSGIGPGGYYNGNYTDYYYAFADETGFPHLFAGTSHVTYGCPPSDPTTTLTTYAADGSGYLLAATGTDVTVIDVSGKQFKGPGSGPQNVIDTNGNQATSNLTYGPFPLGYYGTLTDTSNVSVTVTGGGYNVDLYFQPTSRNPATVSYKDTSGNTQQITITFTGPGFKADSVTFPDGKAYHFGYQVSGCNSGTPGPALGSIQLPTGGTITYQNSPTPDCFTGQPNTRQLTRTTMDGTVTYANTVNSSNAGYLPTSSTTTITYPDSSEEIHFVYSQLQAASNPLGSSWFHFETAHTWMNASSATLKNSMKCYNGSTGDCTSTPIALPITEIRTTTTPDNNQSFVTDRFTNLNGLPTELDEYDFTSSAATRKTVTTYASLGNNILDRPSSISIKDGNNNVLAQTTYGYDEANLTSSGVTGLASVSGARGNRTSEHRALLPGSGTIDRQWNYDDAGQVVKAQNGRQYWTTFGYDPATDSCLNSTTFTTPSSGVAMATSQTCNSYTGLVNTTTDVNSVVTKYSYDASLRQSDVSVASGTTVVAHSTYDYGGATAPIQNKKTIIATPDPDEVTVTTLDGLGRTSSSTGPDGATITTSYDSRGRLHSTSNPTFASSAASTTYFYDGLGRLIQQLQPDGTSKHWCYNASSGTNCHANASGTNTHAAWVDETDERGNAVQRSYDALGRLTGVIEPNAAGLLSAETDYTYSPLDNLTNVDQYSGSTSSTDLKRAFQYDSLSRLKKSCNPENLPTGTTAKCNGSQWPVTYDYDGDDNVIWQGNPLYTITYGYDSLDRLISKTAPDGIDRTQYTYTYDQGINGVGRLSREENPTWSGTQFAYDEVGRIKGTIFFQYNPLRAWQTGMGVQYDLAGNVIQLTYPDGRVVSQGWNGGGQLQSAQDITGGTPGYSYVSALQYWPSGVVKSATYGTAFTTSAQINSRLQICRQQANSSLLPSNTAMSNLMDRQLFYSAVAETNCTDASGNNGSIWHISEQAPAGSSQNFLYDSLNRLTSASTTNRPPASGYSYTYGYDTVGNMAQSDAVNTSPQYTVDQATNRLLLNVSDLQYDAAGHLTQSPNPLGGVHSLGYTAEGYLRLIDNFGTGSYLYNGSGERTLAVRNDNGGGNRKADNFVYLNGQLMASLDDTTGVWTDYIYANGQKIARAQSKSTQIHFTGTNCTGCGLQRTGYYLPLQGYTVQAGDHLAWRQKQSGPAVPRGGIVLRFTDGTYTNWTTTDQNGEVMNSLSVQDQWVARMIDLNPFAGRTQDLSWLIEDAQSGAGDWQEWFADIALIHADGTVFSIFNGQERYPLPSSGTDPYLTNQSFEIEQVPDSNPLTTTKYYLSDQVGTTQYELAAGGWPVWQGFFTPFGKQIINGGTQNALGQVTPDGTLDPVKFTGKERDVESGLDYFGARYYGPTMGRFMSPDLGADAFALPFADLKNPQSLNLYSYVGNSPTSRNDPDGHNYHVCADNGYGGQNCVDLTDDQYNTLVRQQDGQQGISLPGGFGAHGSISCSGTACGTVSYFEPGLQDASTPILASIAGAAAGPGIVRSVFNALVSSPVSGPSVTTTVVNTGERASRLKELFGTEGASGLQGNPEEAARRALQRLQSTKQLPDGLSQSDLDYYKGVMEKAARSPNNTNQRVQSLRGEILTLAERILGGGR